MPGSLSETLSLDKNQKDSGCSPVVERLPTMHKALGSSGNTPKNKIKQKLSGEKD